MYQFSQRSLDRLSTCHADLQLIMLESILTSVVDFGIAEGHRPPEKQFELFKIGRKKENGVWVVEDYKAIVTNIDGFLEKGKHNLSPAEAVDIFAWVKGKRELMYNEVHLAYLGGHILNTGQELLAKGRISHRLRWGGNWDGDGELLYDQKLKDLPHFELTPLPERASPL